MDCEPHTPTAPSTEQSAAINRLKRHSLGDFNPLPKSKRISRRWDDTDLALNLPNPSTLKEKPRLSAEQSAYLDQYFLKCLAMDKSFDRYRPPTGPSDTELEQAESDHSLDEALDQLANSEDDGDDEDEEIDWDNVPPSVGGDPKDQDSQFGDDDANDDMIEQYEQQYILDWYEKHPEEMTKLPLCQPDEDVHAPRYMRWALTQEERRREKILDENIRHAARHIAARDKAKPQPNPPPRTSPHATLTYVVDEPITPMSDYKHYSEDASMLTDDESPPPVLKKCYGANTEMARVKLFWAPKKKTPLKLKCFQRTDENAALYHDKGKLRIELYDANLDPGAHKTNSRQGILPHDPKLPVPVDLPPPPPPSPPLLASAVALAATIEGSSTSPSSNPTGKVPPSNTHDSVVIHGVDVIDSIHTPAQIKQGSKLDSPFVRRNPLKEPSVPPPDETDVLLTGERVYSNSSRSAPASIYSTPKITNDSAIFFGDLDDLEEFESHDIFEQFKRTFLRSVSPLPLPINTTDEWRYA